MMSIVITVAAAFPPEEDRVITMVETLMKIQRDTQSAACTYHIHVSCTYVQSILQLLHVEHH